MFWLNCLILLLLIVGNTQLAVTGINRIHGLKYRCATLRRLRHIHDAWILLFPPLLVVAVGLSGPKVLLNGEWASVPVGWLGYFAVCAAGFLGFAFGAARNFFSRKPAVLSEAKSHTFDVAAQLGYAPTGKGPYHFLTRVPGNEIFQLELSELTFRLPRVPTNWDGLTILHLTDWHFTGSPDLPYYEYVTQLARESQTDMIVFTGDLIDDMRCLDWIPNTLGKMSAPLGCYYILGNHDWYQNAEQVRITMNQNGWIDVAGQNVLLNHFGHSLAIGGSELPWMGTHPDFSTTTEDAFRLFLSHTPDHLPWAQENLMDLMLSGHNHGGQVRFPLVGPVYSPSLYGCRYASGSFWREPTLLHVSRGLGGQHPLRLNCKPEMTKITLRPVLATEQTDEERSVERALAKHLAAEPA